MNKGDLVKVLIEGKKVIAIFMALDDHDPYVYARATVFWKGEYYTCHMGEVEAVNEKG